MYFTVADGNSGSGLVGDLLSISGASSAYTGCTQEGLSVSASTKNQLTGNVYDAAGDLTSIPGIAAYNYDAESRLCSVGGTSCTTGTVYTYDGDGRRVMKSGGKIYWYGTGSDPLVETDLTGAWQFTHYYFGGMRIARRESNNWVDHYGLDHLGNARIVYGNNGGWDQSDFYPFGGERVITSQVGSRYKFTGKERDSESGLDNFGARYDSSQYGRFMSPDPGNAGADASNPQSWNMYSYVLNNPINLIDPEGLCSRSDGSSGSGNDPNSGNSGEVSACDIEQDQSLASVKRNPEPTAHCGFLCNLVGWLGSGAGSGDAIQEVMNRWNWNTLFGGGGGGGASSSQSKNSNNRKDLYCQDDVIAAMNKIWIQSAIGTSGVEASFNVNGAPSKYSIRFNSFTNQQHSQTVQLQANTFANFHVHPNTGSWQPSTPSNNALGNGQGDIGMANRTGIQIYVVSKQGLGFYDPATHLAPVRLRPGMDWGHPCQ